LSACRRTDDDGRTTTTDGRRRTGDDDGQTDVGLEREANGLERIENYKTFRVTVHTILERMVEI
jgi:hypothetical protein